eukprot:6177438-Lingulodinium_polyedra.AAC.1
MGSTECTNTAAAPDEAATDKPAPDEAATDEAASDEAASDEAASDGTTSDESTPNGPYTGSRWRLTQKTLAANATGGPRRVEIIVVVAILVDLDPLANVCRPQNRHPAAAAV